MAETKLNPARRNARAASVTLPSGGRTGDIPPWPLRSEVSGRARLDVWEARIDKFTDEINNTDDKSEINKIEYRLFPLMEKAAILKAEIETVETLEREIWNELWRMPQAEAWERMQCHREVAQYCRSKAKGELGMPIGTDARALSDRLGLTPKAMNDLRWTIPAAETNPTSATTTDARSRFKAS